ncbi:hypothetical protein OIU78_009765 [Salix suchowensis]|nr:hypothetical protein OIU78_009765 [Salix suchowensis]
MRFIDQGLDCKCTCEPNYELSSRGFGWFPLSPAMHGWCGRLKESDLLVDKLSS